MDFGETFSLLVKATTLRVVLTLALSYGWKLKQIDINIAFLNGILQESIYMTQPPGFCAPTHSQYVCRLHQALYGLK